MSDIEKLKAVLTDIGVKYTVREKQSSGANYHYLFVGEYRNFHFPEMTFESADLDMLLTTSRFFEFENGNLASY